MTCAWTLVWTKKFFVLLLDIKMLMYQRARIKRPTVLAQKKPNGRQKTYQTTTPRFCRWQCVLLLGSGYP